VIDITPGLGGDYTEIPDKVESYGKYFFLYILEKWSIHEPN